MLDKVMNRGKGLDHEQHENMLNELKAAIPIVVVNQPRKIYDVERKVDEMLEKGMPFGEVNKEIAKLRKYSF